MTIAFSLLILLLACVSLFLSLWIVVPAPTMLLFPLGVGAPEVSPWLVGLSAIVLALAIGGRHLTPWMYGAIGLSLVSLILSLLPLQQFATADRQAAQVMQSALGQGYFTRITPAQTTLMRPTPLNLIQVFQGIPTSPGRYQPDIPFATPNGSPLTLDLYQPTQAGPHPGMIVLYGGAWQNGSPREHIPFNQYLAAQGYTVFAISYRHAPRYRFPAQLEDVRSALQFIRQHANQYDTDPDRLVLVGRSAGAHLALLAAYQSDAPPIRAVVGYYGPVDLIEGYRDLPTPDPLQVQTVLKTFLGGPPEALTPLYQAASPMYAVRPGLPPTLLIYGQRDHIVMAKFGRQLYDRLRQTGNTAVFIEIPWAEHAFDAVFQGLSNQLALYYTERFLAWAVRPE
ncbi:esterase [Leptolyngbya sp. 'hensonii']|uniref:alpha/beta hydrolase n=1 Tax=Leptolyngbya sp. 'hensonii' TaxID=1922337 RepID=UPI00094F63BA|nr:alpha/beta hydrolase [Leptolyngbya sp. 'hensonii']OLP20179.1 esterase [Leptolyngbya sp. 'hensonii']